MSENLVGNGSGKFNGKFVSAGKIYDKTYDVEKTQDAEVREVADAKSSEGHEGPVSHGWFSLGQGRGIKWTLWKTSVTFQRSEKQGDKWITLEELHVAPKILKEFVWRIPGWLEIIDKNNGKNLA